MSQHLKRSPTGHLRRNPAGHLVRFCNPGFEVSLASEVHGGGWADDAEDYDAAWLDLPAFGWGPHDVSCGYVWPQSSDHLISAFGFRGGAGPISMVSIATARLRVTVTKGGDNNWAGDMTLAVRYKADEQAPADLEDALAWGTGAAGILFEAADMTKTVTLDLDPTKVPIDGYLNMAIVPDCDTDPGDPGVEGYYRRSVTVAARLLLTGVET